MTLLACTRVAWQGSWRSKLIFIFSNSLATSKIHINFDMDVCSSFPVCTRYVLSLRGWVFGVEVEVECYDYLYAMIDVAEGA